ncbi:MAG: response regulator [Patescibacteria group bacterium]
MSAKKILTIDDDPFYEKLYQDIFSMQGFEVKHAFNAADGLKLIKSFKPDLVTLDVMMPEKDNVMDGFEFLKQLKACDEDCRHVPIIMISALSEPSDIRQASELGVTHYIPKQNLTPHFLLDEVRQILK